MSQLKKKTGFLTLNRKTFNMLKLDQIFVLLSYLICLDFKIDKRRYFISQECLILPHALL